MPELPRLHAGCQGSLNLGLQIVCKRQLGEKLEEDSIPTSFACKSLDYPDYQVLHLLGCWVCIGGAGNIPDQGLGFPVWDLGGEVRAACYLQLANAGAPVSLLHARPFPEWRRTLATARPKRTACSNESAAMFRPLAGFRGRSTTYHANVQLAQLSTFELHCAS